MQLNLHKSGITGRITINNCYGLPREIPEAGRQM